MELLELHLFAGAGGGILGGHLLGHRVIGAVEIEAYPRKVLLARQLDGSLPRFPIWDDVTTFRLDNPDTRNYIERLQSVRDRLVICGGFPCQDISAAGKGAGIEGARSGMWKEMARIIGEIRPRYAFVENSPMLTTRGLGVVLADLASMGFDAEWGVLSAAEVGAPHLRERIWILGRNTKWELADTNVCRYKNGQAEINTADTRLNAQCEFSPSSDDVADTLPSWEWRKQWESKIEENAAIPNSIEFRLQTERPKQQTTRIGGIRSKIPNTNSTQCKRAEQPIGSIKKHAIIGQPSWWQTEPNVDRVVNGVAFRVDRLKAIGNGQVSLCAATAFELLRERLEQ